MSEELRQIMTMLQQLKQDNDAIRQENSLLRQQMEQLQSSHASTSAPTIQTFQVEPPTSAKAPKISMPDKFDGNRRKFCGFVNQVKLVFQMQPNTYHTDMIKIGFIGSLLSGPALDWFASLMEKSSPLLLNMKDFSTHLKLALVIPTRHILLPARFVLYVKATNQLQSTHLNSNNLPLTWIGMMRPSWNSFVLDYEET